MKYATVDEHNMQLLKILYAPASPWQITSMKKLKTITIIQLVVLFLVPVTSFPGEKDDDTALLEKAIQRYQAIKTIDARISQHIIETGKETALYEGRYRARGNTMLRVDYDAPEPQVVLVKDGALQWYYPEAGQLYYMDTPGASGQKGNVPSVNPLQELLNKRADRFTIEYDGIHLYGLFRRARCFIMKDNRQGTTLEIWLQQDTLVPIRKIVRDRSGRELVRETYEKYEKINGILFPRRVEVVARTREGMVRNITGYSRVQLNKPLDKGIFTLELPKDVVRKRLY